RKKFETNWPAAHSRIPAMNDLIERLAKSWTDFLDANPDGLTSPEDLPDHALMTGDQFVAFARAALYASPAPAVKPGWRLVPEDPTVAMLNAFDAIVRIATEDTDALVS